MIIFKKLRLQDEKQYENLYEIRVKGHVCKERDRDGKLGS